MKNKAIRVIQLTLIILFVGLLSVSANSYSASGEGTTQAGQQKSVSGKVTDSNGEAIPGASVVVKGTTVGTSTNVDGVYNLVLPANATTLVVSFVGMKNTEVAINGQSTINVTLESDFLAVDEVVVTALGITKEKKALGYAVTEVGSDDISLVKDHNPVNSLAGKVAGVVITQGTGGPGGGSRIVIRGNNSINGNNQPLIVVDGIPIDASGSNSGGSVYNSTVTGGGITDINPDDIESISVLKGPNAAALYGSRAANGVLLVTTKSGKKGKGIGVSINSNITFDAPMVLPEYQNEYGQGSQGNVPGNVTDLKNAAGSWGPKLDGSSKLYYTGENRPYVAQADNVKDFFRTAGKYINSVSLDGGGDDYAVRFSYTNNYTESMLPNSDLTSHNFNLRGQADLAKNLSVDAKATYFYQDLKNRASQGSEGIMAYVLGMPRNVDVTDLETYQKPEESLNSISYSALGANPYWILRHDVNKNRRERLLGFAKVTYKFTDYLSAFVRIGTDVATTKSESVNQPGHHFYNKGRLNYGNDRASETNADFLLMFNKKLTDDINLSINAGANHSFRTWEAMSIFGENFKIPTRATVANCVTIRPSYSPMEKRKVNSVYGAASLSYKDYLYLDITGRNDWSSTLSEDNRSYFYPSVGLSFLADRLLDPEQTMFNLLKVRANYAMVGGDTTPYQLNPYFDVSQDGYLGLTTLSRPAVKFKPDLKPESTNSLEFGLETRMLNNRIFLDLSLYSIKTIDMIFDVPVPAATGYSSFRENIGEMSNKGIEFLLGGTPVRGRDFSWEVSVNFSKNKNKLVELTEELDSHVLNTTNSGNVAIQATVGGGYGDIWGTVWRKSPDGKLMVNAEGAPMASSERVFLGNSQPDWVGGLTNTFTYKDFSFRFLVDARIGGELYSQTNAALISNGTAVESLEFRENGITVDGVVENNGTYSANTKNISAQDYWGAVSGIGESNIYKQTNIRLREFVFSYNLPKSLLSSTPIKGASIGLVGRNLFFLYKDVKHVDPEASLGTSNNGQGIISYNLPTARSIGFNLNIKF